MKNDGEAVVSLLLTELERRYGMTPAEREALLAQFPEHRAEVERRLAEIAPPPPPPPTLPWPAEEWPPLPPRRPRDYDDGPAARRPYEPPPPSAPPPPPSPRGWRLLDFIRGLFRKAPPKPRPSPVPDKGSSEVVRCHSDVSFPAQAVLGRSEFLHVRLVRAEERTATGEVRQTPKPHAHDVTVAVETAAPVTVSVAAEGFEIDGRRQAELALPGEGNPPETLFILRGTRLGLGRVMVDFFQNGRPVGAVNLFSVVAAAPAPAVGRARVEAPAEGLRLSASPPPAPDLVIQVFENRSAGAPGRLQFVLFSTRPDLRDLPVCFGDVGTLDLKSDVGEWVETHLRRLGAVADRPGAGEEVAHALADVGSQFWEQLLPPDLQRLYWTLRQRGVRTVLVLSDEPHIPWELIKPYRKDPATGKWEAEDVFWGEAFALSRWLRGRPPVQSFSLDRVFALAASGAADAPPAECRDILPVAPGAGPPPPAKALPCADEELILLHSLKAVGAGVETLPARRRDLHAALERGGFTLLHLACHGAFGGAARADASAVRLEDGEFSAAELSPRLEASIRRGAPLIFFNACHSGRVGFSLTRLGSWGARLVDLGCGAFVGALWPVTDHAALTFARAFYERLTRGEPIAEAVAAARQCVRERHPDDPTWLAYCCFADPLARVEPRPGAAARYPV